jgi:crotonobetainyl-CoA:carnitine CoA-transferase CaiB-like acyl-CoA transferase
VLKPLENIRVVTLAVNVPGPLAAKRWLDLGATVIKVEPPEGDPLELYCPDWYQDINAGQQTVRLNLKTEEGNDELTKLLLSADLLLTAQRPNALKRLGLDWRVLQVKYPQLNHLAIVGFPSPNENEAGHDLTYQASFGLLNPPNMPKTLMADMAGAERAALEGLALLMGRKAGRQKMVTLYDAAEYMAQPVKYGLTTDNALLGGGQAEYALYEANDGWLAIAALEPHFSARLKAELRLEELNHEALSNKFKQGSTTDWVDWAKQYDIPLVAVKPKL